MNADRLTGGGQRVFQGTVAAFGNRAEMRSGDLPDELVFILE
jgi:hypothetical protein